MNFRSILSKTSLKSSCSKKTLTHSKEILKLQSEIESLKGTVNALKITIERRDDALGTITREKEKIYLELKTAQRTQRNLHQQLDDERYIYSQEKEYLINENKRLSQRKGVKAAQNEDSETIVCPLAPPRSYQQGQVLRDYEDQTKSLYEELKTKDEIICNIGAKYMKIKSSKTNLQKKIERMIKQYKEMCENIIHILQENRQSVDNLLYDLMMSSTISADTKKYLNLLQVNASLHYENIQLKIYLSTKNCSDIIPQESNFFEKKFDESGTHIGNWNQAKTGSKSEARKTEGNCSRHSSAT